MLLQSFLFVLAFLVFLCTCKFLKLLRFNKKMNMLGYTLLYIAKPFLNFMVALITVFIAYSHTSYLVFNTVLAEFQSLGRAMTTLFTLMLSKYMLKNLV